MTAINGITHISLSVLDLEVSERFYRELFSMEVIVDGIQRGGYHETILRIPGRGGIGLCLQAHKANDGQEFSPQRSGLDHLAFGVDDLEALRGWAQHLDARGIGHSGVNENGSFGHVINFRDPDGIQIELHCF